MKLLLDTCTFLWQLADESKLSHIAYDHLRDTDHELYLSAASAWEIAIKVAIGKLPMKDPLATLLDAMHRNGIHPLAVEHEHALHTGTLPAHHRDPFDRMLVAQAQL